MAKPKKKVSQKSEPDNNLVSFSHIVPPTKDLSEAFITQNPDQLKHITNCAIRTYDMWKLKNVMKFDVFLSFTIMMYLTGRNTLFCELVESQEKINREEEEQPKLSNIIDTISSQVFDNDCEGGICNHEEE